MFATCELPNIGWLHGAENGIHETRIGGTSDFAQLLWFFGHDIAQGVAFRFKPRSTGDCMNPYEANFSNTVARLGAWGRGMLRLYRRQLLAIAAATATMAIGVSAAQAPTPVAVPAPIQTAGN